MIQEADGHVLPESSAILKYLAQKFSVAGHFYPGDAPDEHCSQECPLYTGQSMAPIQWFPCEPQHLHCTEGFAEDRVLHPMLFRQPAAESKGGLRTGLAPLGCPQRGCRAGLEQGSGPYERPRRQRRCGRSISGNFEAGPAGKDRSGGPLMRSLVAHTIADKLCGCSVEAHTAQCPRLLRTHGRGVFLVRFAVFSNP